MYDCIILCKSLTYAQRARRIFEQHGILCLIVRAPSGLTGSCGYALKFRRRRLEEALALEEKYRLPLGGAYEIIDGDYRKV